MIYYGEALTSAYTIESKLVKLDNYYRCDQIHKNRCDFIKVFTEIKIRYTTLDNYYIYIYVVLIWSGRPDITLSGH